MTADEVISLFASFGLNDGETAYLRGQARRLAYLCNLVQRYINERKEPCSILDVGPHFLTRCLLEKVSPTPRMSTLGYPFPKLVPASMVHEHATVDLNDSASLPLPFAAESFDIIVICEVIEHLLVPPDLVLSFLKKLVKQPDGIIIVGTPNAVCLANRLRMVMGENPFHALSRTRSNAGHIREYTMAELRGAGELAGLKVVFDEYCNYWGQSMHIANIANLEEEVPSYRTGLTIIYQA